LKACESNVARVLLRRGLGLIEVIVVLVIVAFVGLLLITALPRQRESSRSAVCRSNLMQIGMALALYEQSARQLPTVPDLSSKNAVSPLGAMLGELGLADFTGLDPRQAPPKARTHANVVERRLPAFICPSDPIATSSLFLTPLSYRASTGDCSDGRTGAFAPGKLVRSADVEAGDGLAYTAAFTERLVGNLQPVPDLRNYAVVPGPVGDQGCPRALQSAWQGDAGSTWMVAEWRSTLYNHVLTPDASPSCVADDRGTSTIGASSGHPQRVHVLLLDGSVRPFTPQVDAKIWRGLGNINDRGKAPAP
jgi:type II secretory pathway pseudopilin PulG